MRYHFADYGGIEIPYPVYPEAGGLLPLGSLGETNFLNWLTVGDPDTWPFVYFSKYEGFIQVTGLSAIEFIQEVITGRSPLLIQTGFNVKVDVPCEFIPFDLS